MRRLRTATLALLMLLGVAQWVRFPRLNPPVEGALAAPMEVATVLRNACYDCHSNETEWPWYSAIAPLSWWVHHEVDGGRRRLNFSEWAAYASDPDTASQKLDEIAKLVASGDMAPWHYRIVHPGARLSAPQRDLLIHWATHNRVPPVSSR
jgi:heme-binding protein